MDDTDSQQIDQRGWGIRASDQVTVSVIIVLAVAAIAGSWIYRGGLRGRLIDIETADAMEVTFQLDVNSAAWPEWTLLPGVGEKMAKRIVKNREERGPFRSHADLRRVSGIGPRTLDRLRPYLLPLDLLPRAATKQPTEDDVAARR